MIDQHKLRGRKTWLALNCYFFQKTAGLGLGHFDILPAQQRTKSETLAGRGHER